MKRHLNMSVVIFVKYIRPFFEFVLGVVIEGNSMSDVHFLFFKWVVIGLYSREELISDLCDGEGGYDVLTFHEVGRKTEEFLIIGFSPLLFCFCFRLRFFSLSLFPGMFKGVPSTSTISCS